jgi:hypothetical protein
MLLGSWVLTSPPPEQYEQNALPPTAEQAASPVVPGGGGEPRAPGKIPRENVRPDARPDLRSYERSSWERGKAQNRGTPQRNKMQNTPSGMLEPGTGATTPTAPTDPSLGVAPGMPPMPTGTPFGGNFAAGEGSVPQDQLGSNASRIPVNPTYRRPTGPPPNASIYALMEEQRQFSGSTGFRSFPADTGVAKPFGGSGSVYTSGVSPYMNLFRNDTNGGTLDNYTTLVRPQLQQQRMNQQFGTDLFGLRRETGIQQLSLQQMQRTSRTLQGVATPQFYMNYGSYYQGYGSPGYGNQGYGP